MDFCEQHNVGLDSFRIWDRKLRSENVRNPDHHAFLSVKVAPDVAQKVPTKLGACVEIRLNNSRVLIVRDVCLKTQLADLIQIAESVTPC